MAVSPAWLIKIILSIFGLILHAIHDRLISFLHFLDISGISFKSYGESHCDITKLCDITLQTTSPSRYFFFYGKTRAGLSYMPNACSENWLTKTRLINADCDSIHGRFNPITIQPTDLTTNGRFGCGLKGPWVESTCVESSVGWIVKDWIVRPPVKLFWGHSTRCIKLVSG